MAQLIEQYRGRVVDAPGDNLLAEFGSVVEAVQCAVAMQRALAARNAELPAQRQMTFRIGINLGDVVAEQERLMGMMSTWQLVWRAWRRPAAFVFRAPCMTRSRPGSIYAMSI